MFNASLFDTRALTKRALANLGPRFLPFADVASPDLPLGRLLRLSLFQVTVGMALVLLLGTLNRVMIVELGVSAGLVGVMISLPLLFAPFRALIGFRSDIHVSPLGWRRVPYIWKGTLLQFGGFAVMPFALLVLSGYAEAAHAPAWIGVAGAAIAFLLVGAGAHMVQTVGLALATDLAPAESQPKVVGLMSVMMLIGMLVSALAFGALLADYTPGRLIQVIQGAAVLTVALNLIALWKQESRDRTRLRREAAPPDFLDTWRAYARDDAVIRRLVVVGLGGIGFGMADVLLEPFGGQVLAMTVGQTTQLTAALAIGGVAGFALASRTLGRGREPLSLAWLGGLVGIGALAMILLSGPLGAVALFALGVAGVGFGAGLFGHGCLTATMRAAPREQTGLALGAWGAAQATAAGIGIALGGALRDVVSSLPIGQALGALTPYAVVFVLEIAVLLAALIVLSPLLRGAEREALGPGRA